MYNAAKRARHPVIVAELNDSAVLARAATALDNARLTHDHSSSTQSRQCMPSQSSAARSRAIAP
jgi:hypothetical protein